MQMCLSSSPLSPSEEARERGVWVRPLAKDSLSLQVNIAGLEMQRCLKHGQPVGPESLSATPFRDDSALAVPHTRFGEGNSLLWSLPHKGFVVSWGQAWKITHGFIARSQTSLGYYGTQIPRSVNSWSPFELANLLLLLITDFLYNLAIAKFHYLIRFPVELFHLLSIYKKLLSFLYKNIYIYICFY